MYLMAEVRGRGGNYISGCTVLWIITCRSVASCTLQNCRERARLSREFTKGGLVKGALAIYVLLLYYC